ncbi:MAG: hypothetical protein IPF66_06025 [Holophagales bacterium]|nr:hypothetical protein [Holophagales bacterium]
MAGTATIQAAPGGMSDIVRRSGLSTLGSVGGLTQIKSAAAFAAPAFNTRNVAERKGPAVEHFAESRERPHGMPRTIASTPGPAITSGPA